MKSIVFILLGMLILSSCATGIKTTKLREGLTKDEVIGLVGSPDGYQRAGESGEYEALHYIDRRTTAWSFLAGPFYDVLDYSVILKDGRVIEYGPGKAQQRESGETPFRRIPYR
ncbi:hypothetical protein [Nitrosovibrio sp. Nv17]|jgi:hypothetical protein|uniref:hypothetical protein n=1 Tax=Nitrosovibrio sp. Nv17 TaxID=1855339 RepID=UPI0009091116|nr:hypothetical protein [Nitrosovibrio sp. Nv17]SFW21076.1 hypothetical protein SAMN05216414_10617 [Nitrosovibrio sp. Nv17]